jgi:dienelactone hydrolase
MTRVSGRTERPYLHVNVPKTTASAIALVLHGGAARSTEHVTVFSLAAARMVPFDLALRSAGRADGLVVARLRYRQRGWNGSAQAPVHDARWALTQLTERFPNLPVGLIGHSMGGRTAMYVADEPAVHCVVGLAPWLEREDSLEPLRGRRVLIVHGDADHITDPRASASFAGRLQGLAVSSAFVTVTGEKHSMLHRPRVWHELAAGFTVGALLGKTSSGTEEGPVANVVAKALAGQPKLIL